ncbi:hypothetical protein PSHT_13158 [Puccinia striiformis]|uniref:Myb/SANT-like domain-containing protein n=1 Tax=Puccinia striiformis TaxID=27350 RepID=A0A2S4USB7_9BASI|nr:hypothetical protein PSHT_13158 [Puccinia striiformis]
MNRVQSETKKETKRDEPTLEQTLLELLAEQTLAGLATDTSGLKKEGWTTIAQKMNANTISASPGFGWDEIKQRVFNGRSASGEMVASERVPITTTAIKVTPASKRKAAVDNDNDSEIKVDPTSSVTLASTKHIHESKNLVIEKEMEGIQGALLTVSENSKELISSFTKIALAISQPTSNHQENDLSMSQRALDVFANRFLGKVADNVV